MEQVHCLKWFLVQLKPNSAQIAKRNLERQGFRVFNPTRLITKRASSKFVDKHEQLFPGYMFVSMIQKMDAGRRSIQPLALRGLCSSDQCQNICRSL